MTCETCRWWLVSADPAGDCRRFPKYEVRQKTEWCGEYLEETAGIKDARLAQEAKLVK